MGWLIALAVIVLLAVLPLGASVKYDAGGPLVRLIIGPWHPALYPRKKQEKPEKEKKDKPKKKSGPKTKSAPEKKSGGKLTDFLPLAQTALALLNDLRRKLRVKNLELKIIMAGDDPCDLAVNYGRAWAALGNLMPRLERFLVIRKRDLQVECDFTADETYIYARMDVTITLGRLVYLAARYGVRALKQFMKIQKGGAENEQEPSQYAGKYHPEDP